MVRLEGAKTRDVFRNSVAFDACRLPTQISFIYRSNRCGLGAWVETKKAVVRAFSPEAKLKRAIRRHFTRLGFERATDGTLVLPGTGKDVVRSLHSGQRAEKLDAGRAFLERSAETLLPWFANGSEIEPASIRLRLVRVRSDTREADLFRLASLTWSVPVSVGFGRRLRYLVWDEAHQRIAGIIALGDPVFNLSVRDNLIGWTPQDRSERLVSLLDAYVMGAVPPYNALLAGKAIACLVRSTQVFDDFKRAYGKSTGIISGSRKNASLLAITTTSSMGRSSIYNRLALDGTKYFVPIGYTVGWGHFHITDRIFDDMREFLRLRGHRYADRHKYGEGPNWRMRTIRTALRELGINEALLRHGVQREVFLATLSTNALTMLKTGSGRPDLSTLRTVEEISDLALARWMLPRSERNKDYLKWRREGVLALVAGGTSVAGVARRSARTSRSET